MQVYREISNCPKSRRIITLGSFDGVHRGHVSVLHSLVQEAKKNNCKSMVVTFDPHPQLVINNPNRPPLQLLNDLNEKLLHLEACGIDEVMIIPFTKEFSQLSPDKFILDILLKEIGFEEMLAGYDNLFGANRGGNFTLLRQLSETNNFKVKQLQCFTTGETVISSTKIRKLIAETKLQEANNLLGYAYTVSGKIVHGNKLGRKIGFPTINIEATNPHKLLPGHGVYLTKVRIDNEIYFGMANIGCRPTLTDDKQTTLEINIFDFDKDVYSKPVTAIFYKHIRDEIKYNGLQELIQALQTDKDNCIKLLKEFV